MARTQVVGKWRYRRVFERYVPWRFYLAEETADRVELRLLLMEKILVRATTWIMVLVDSDSVNIP